MEKKVMEAEKIELEWESMWERIGASLCKIQREQEAKLDKILRSLHDLRSTMETTDASSGSCKSQLELPKLSDNLDFQQSIDVDRAIVDEDLIEQHSSERYEEMDTESVGVGNCPRVSKDIEDIDFVEVEIVMPLPNIKRLGSDSHESHGKGRGVQRMELVVEEDTGIDSMPISIPMHVLQPEMKQVTGKGLWNQENEQVMDVDSEYMIPKYERKLEGIGIQLQIQDREGIGVVFPDYMVCHVSCPQAKKLKEVESLPTALQNASMRELAVILPISTCYSLSLSWLLKWFPRPMVKMKLVTQRDDELYEGFDDHCKGFLGCGGCSIFDARGCSVIRWKNGFTVVENQPDQMSGALWHLLGQFDGVFSLSHVKGFSFYSSARINNEDEDWVYYSNRQKSDVGCSHVENLASNIPEQTSFQNSKRSILPWRRRELSFRSPKAKGELFLKKSYRKEGGGDIDFDRRQLSSNEGASLGWYRTDEESNTNRASVTEFGDDSFAVGTLEQKEITSRDGHLKIQTEEGNFDFLHGATSFDNIWDEIATVCTLTEHKENVLYPWKISFNVLHDLSQGMKNKISIVVVGSVSLNLAEYASKTEEHVEVKLLLTVTGILVENRPMLCLSFSLLELMDGQEAAAVVQSPVMSLTYPSASGEICAMERDEVSALKAGRRKVKIFTDYVSTHRGSEEMSSAKSEEGERPVTSVLTELVLVSLAGKMKVHKLSDIGFLVLIWFPKPRVKMKLGKMRHKKLGSMNPCGQGILRGRDCLSEASVRGNGHLRSETEAAGGGERVLVLEEVGCAKSLPWSGCSLGSLKKVKRLVFVIPCGQGILRGMDCYGHKL